MPPAFELNLRHLRAIAIIATEGSLGAAAAAASLSQPALTQGLAKIERSLNVRLFDRRPQGMVATAEGTALAARIDAAFEHLAAAARTAAGGVRGLGRTEHMMTSTQLRAFLALADHGGFAGAARAEGWAQPAVHRAVRDLELLAAVPLLERRGRGVALTHAGRKVVRGIRLAKVELDAGILETRADNRLRGRLRIGAMPLCRARLLPEALAALLREAPDATIDVVEGSWRELVEPLRDGLIDFMIGALRPDQPDGLEQRQLLVDRLAIVARSGHPLAHVPTGTADLLRFPWIVGHPGSPLRAHWDELFPTDKPHAPIECGSVMTIRGVLLNSDCLTLLSPAQVAIEVGAGLLRTIEPPHAALVRTIGVTTRRGMRSTRLQSCFLEAMASASISNTNGP